jgi:hypothetical protein
MDLRLATLKSVSFYSLHNVSTWNHCRKFSCVTVVYKHFASYHGYPNYKWDLIRYAKGFSACSEYYLLILRWHYANGTWYICVAPPEDE